MGMHLSKVNGREIPRQPRQLTWDVVNLVNECQLQNFPLYSSLNLWNRNCHQTADDTSLPQRICMPDMDKNNSEIMRENPSLKTRRVSSGLSHYAVRWLWWKQQVHPHDIQWVQAPLSDDTVAWFVFYQQLLHQWSADSTTLTCDRCVCSFPGKSTLNFQNWHIVTDDNFVWPGHNQHGVSVSMWTRSIENPTSSCTLPGNLNSLQFLSLLHRHLPELLLTRLTSQTFNKVFAWQCSSTFYAESMGLVM